MIGESAAGRAFGGLLGPRQAVRICTGAPMPEGADAIVIQENVKRDGDRIEVAAAVSAGDHLRPKGLDFKDGEALIPAGRRLSPRDVALAAAANHPDLPVRRRARVAILATGDELVPPGGSPGPSQIIASNNFAVAGVVQACGGIAIDLGIALDRMEALDAAIRKAREVEADVLVTLGGASVGDHDLVQKALVAAGMRLGFWRIAMRPGKPLMHGRLGDMRVLGLPGNPTSSMVCAILFLRPLLRALHGEHGQVGALGDPHPEWRCLPAHPGEILVARTGVDDGAESGRRSEINDEIVDDAAAVIEHAAVERLAGRLQLADVVGEQPLKERPDPVAREVDDAHVRDVEYTSTPPDGVVLRDLGAVLQRHVPAAKVHHPGAELAVQVE